MSYFAIGLDNPKFKENVGSAMRAAGCFGAAFVASTGTRFGKITDTQSEYKRIPLIRTSNLHEIIPYDCIPVAVDLIKEDERSISLVNFKHPKRAFYIFGAEDATLGKRVTDYCKHIVYVPTNYCMNLAASVNVILYDRIAKNYLEV